MTVIAGKTKIIEALIASSCTFFCQLHEILQSFGGHTLSVIFSFSEVACVAALCIILTQAIDAVFRAEPWSLVLICALAASVVIITFLIWRHPQNPTKATFMVSISERGAEKIPCLFSTSTSIN